MSLQLENIAVEYGKASHAHRAVDGVSLHLPTGEIGALIGPSGCGKSSLLRAVAGLQAIAQGQIVSSGQTISTPEGMTPPEVRGVGMVFQDYALFPHMNIARNVGFGLAHLPRPARQERIAEVLQLVGLADLAGRMPHELSGGQQQRVALARALARKPSVLLLDEPFSSLDAAMREKLAQEVRSILKAAGSTALVVTHDQHEAFAMADEIGVMAEGRIQQWDTPYNLYHQPANLFVADFVGQGAFLPGTVINAGSVEVELGVLRSSLPLECTPGCRDCRRGCHVAVLLRPDDVIHDDGSHQKAEVVSRAFRGAEFLYTLRLASGLVVQSLVPSHHNHAIGERIGIRLDVDHVVAFRTETGASVARGSEMRSN